MQYWSGQQFASCDPSQWPDDVELSVNVGLGTGNKDQALQYLGLIGTLQEKLIALQGGNANGPYVTSDNIANAERGAIDFIDKGRGVDVLVTRLRLAKAAWAAAAHRQPETRFICGKLVLAIGRAYWNEADVGLTLGEYKIVHLLSSSAGRPADNRAIYD